MPFYKQICSDLILPYLDETILEDINEHLSPQDACVHIKLCKGTDREPINLLDTSVGTVFSEAKCGVCQSVVGYAKHMLWSDLSKKPKKLSVSDQEITSVLHSLPHSVPQILKSGCEELLNTKTIKETFMHSLRNKDLTPYEICQNVSYCHITNLIQNRFDSIADMLKKNVQQHQNLESLIPNIVGGDLTLPGISNDLQCQLCQWAISAIEAYLSQDTTEAELGRILQELCTIMPGEYSKLCQSFVSVYMSEAMLYVLDNLTPPLICSNLLRVC
eukprot:TRINITY_DN3156_c0_g1_i1.p1 TRINITY_DN3156_c0_g1~~TRINITY_DN3156_c0_g1_i1.p1  ORF type:complete len:274 (-),score=37.49 TRINITY_DN3156_c0_g1_i1:62-883(-)